MDKTEITDDIRDSTMITDGRDVIIYEGTKPFST